MRSAETWIAVFGLGVLGLTWPVLEIFRRVAYGYLLVFWLLDVALLAFVARRGRPR